MSKNAQIAVIILLLGFALSWLIFFGVTVLLTWSFGIAFQYSYVWGVWLLYVMFGSKITVKKTSKSSKKLRTEIDEMLASMKKKEKEEKEGK